MSVFEILLLGVFAAFWVLEFIGHYILRNKPGGETISHQTRRYAQLLTGRYWHLITWIPGFLLICDLEGWL